MRAARVPAADDVVVTGIGLVSPLGASCEETWSAVVEGRSGISRITQFDASAFGCQVGGRGPSVPARVVDDSGAHFRVTDYAAAAIEAALADAGIASADWERAVGGVVVATHGVCLRPAEMRAYIGQGQQGRDRLCRVQAIGFVARTIGELFGTGGPVIGLTTACSSGAMALIEASRLLQVGDASVVVAGGTDAVLNEVQLLAFGELGALTTHNSDPPTASRPFDSTRTGFVISEGACFLTLERYADASARGVRVYGAVAGWGARIATNHVTSSSPDGAIQTQCMQDALARASLCPADVDYVNAHGSGTRDNDVAESRAINTLLGDRASEVPVSSTKGATGHLIAAAGTAEAAFCLLAMRDHIVPPTINLHSPDPECQLRHVANTAQKAEVGVAISNSFGLGGSNVSLVLTRVEP